MVRLKSLVSDLMHLTLLNTTLSCLCPIFPNLSYGLHKCKWLYGQVEEDNFKVENAVARVREEAKEEEVDDPIDAERREKVKEAAIHAWNSYEKYAWGQDELQV